MDPTSPTLPPWYGEDHESFRASVRRLVAGEVTPRLEDWRAARTVPADLLQALGEQGFLGTNVPEEFGGSETGDPRFTAVLVEELAAAGATGLATLVAHQCGVAVPALLRMPQGALRATTVARVAAGEALLVPVVLDESLEAQGVVGALAADAFVVLYPGPDGGARAALLGLDAVDVSAGPPPLGGRESGLADVRLRPELLSASAVDPDPSLVRRDADLWAAVVAAAAGRRSLELALHYVAERRVFGQPLSRMENTRMRLAELKVQLSLVQRYVSHCLDRLGDGTLSAVEAAAARMAATDACDQAADQSLQLHGGYGYMREYPVSHAFADARFLRQSAAAFGDPRSVVVAALAL